MTAASPRLARGVSITRRQISEDEVYYLVRDARHGSFLRMGEVEAAVLRLLDGTRSPPDVAATLARTHDVSVDAATIETFVAGLVRRGLVESREFDPEEFRREWAQQQRYRRRTLGQILGTLAYLKIHLFNPQRLFSRLVGPLGFFWTRTFVVVSLAVMVVACVMSAFHYVEILKSAQTFFAAATSSGGALVSSAVVFYLTLFLVVAVHEMAHGLTCAHFGGRVNDMGFILFYLQVPGMYCDITDAYAFERRSQRLWTTFAGSYTGLLLASVGFFCWWASETGDLSNSFGVMLMFIGGPPALAFNWNPLLRLDGYYMLMDALEAPNLMGNSYRYLGFLLKSRLLRVPVEPMAVPLRLRRVYVVYGICSFLFMAPWVISMPLVAYYIFSNLFGAELAVPVAAFLGWRALSRPAGKLFGTLRYAWLSHRPALASGQRGGARAAALLASAAAVSALLVFGPRVAVRARGIGILAPIQQVDVRADWPGFVPLHAGMPSDVPAIPGMPLEGSRVAPGDVLVRLSNPELEAELRGVTLEARALQLERASLEARGDPGSAAAKGALLRAALARAAILTSRAKSLTLASPIEGVVLTPRLQDRAGAYVRTGESWCAIGSLDRLRARVTLTERDLGLISMASLAEVKGIHLPAETFPGKVARMPAGRRPPRPQGPAPLSASTVPGDGLATVDGSLDVEVEVEDPRGLLRPGMTVRVVIYGERLTLAGHAARWAHRLFKGRVWW